MIFWISISN